MAEADRCAEAFRVAIALTCPYRPRLAAWHMPGSETCQEKTTGISTTWMRWPFSALASYATILP
jgi:hypothetical protein